MRQSAVNSRRHQLDRNSMRKDYHAYTGKSGEHIETRGLGPMQPAPRGDQWISDDEKEIPNPYTGNSTKRVNLEVREPVYPLQTSSNSQSKNLSKSFSTTALSSKSTPAKRDVSNKKSFDENIDPVEAEVEWPIDDNQPIQRGHKKCNPITPSSKRIERHDPKDTRDQLKRSLNDASTVLSEERLSSVASSTSSLSNDELTKIARRALDASNMTTSSSIKEESDDYGTTCTSSTNRSTRLAVTKAKLNSTRMVPAQKQQDDDEKTVSSISSARIVRFSAAKKRVQGRKHADDDDADSISVSSNNQKMVRERALKLAAQARLRKIEAERKTQLHSSDSVFDTKPLTDSREYSSRAMSDEKTLILTESLKSAPRNDSLPKMNTSITSPMKIEKTSLSKTTIVSQPLKQPEEKRVLSNDSSRLKNVPTQKQVGKVCANPGNNKKNHASITPQQPLENNGNLDDITRKLHRRRAFLSAAERARSVSPLQTEIPVKNPSKSSPVLQTTSTLSSDEDHVNDKETAGLLKGAGSRSPPLNISKLQAIRVESTGSNISDNTPRVKNTSLKIANEKSSVFNQEKRHTDSESNISSPPSTVKSGISSADSGQLSHVSMRKYSPALVTEAKVQNREVRPGASAGTCGKEIRKPSVKITVATSSSESKPVIHMSSSIERPSGLSDSRKLEKSLSSHNQVGMPLGRPLLNQQDSDPTIQRKYDQKSETSNATKAPNSKSQQLLSEEHRKQDIPGYDKSPLRERLHNFRSRLNASQSMKSDPPEDINRSSSKGAATQHQKVDPPENGSDVCSMEDKNASSTYVAENTVSLTLSKPLASRNAYVEHLQQKKADKDGRPSPIVKSTPATIALYSKERDFRPERNSQGKQVTNLHEKHDVIPKFSDDPINVDIEGEMDDDDRKSEELLSSPRLSEDSLLAYSESEAGSTFSGFKNTTQISNPTFSATEGGNMDVAEKRKDDYPNAYNADDTDIDESLMKSDDSKLVGQSIIESRNSSEMGRLGEGNDVVNNKSNNETTSQLSVALQWWQQNYAQTQHESVNKSVEKALSSVSKLEDKSIAKDTNPIFGEGYTSKKGCNGEIQSQTIRGSNNVSISIKDEASHDEESIFSGLEDNNLAPPTSLKVTNLSTELNRDEKENVKYEDKSKSTKLFKPGIPPPPPQKHLGTLLDEIQMMSTVNSDITVSVAANEVLKETIKEDKFGNTKHPIEKEDSFPNATISQNKNDNGENFVSEKIEGNGFKFDDASEIQPDDETMGSSSIQAVFKRFGDKILDHFDFICRSPDLSRNPKSDESVESHTEPQDISESLPIAATKMMEATKWDDWDRNESQSAMSTADMYTETSNELQLSPSTFTNDITATSYGTSRYTGEFTAEDESKFTEVSENQIMAHKKLMKYAQSAMTLSSQESSVSGSNAYENSTLEFPDSESSNCEKEVAQISHVIADGVATSTGNEQILKEKPPMHGSLPSALSLNQHRILTKFFNALRKQGMEVLKQNRDTKWQVRYLTISKEVKEVSRFDNREEVGDLRELPLAILWLKRFSSRCTYSTSLIDKHGRGGLMLSHLTRVTASGRSEVVGLMPKKFQDAYKESVIVSLEYEISGSMRALVLRCKTTADAHFLCTGLRVCSELLKKEQQVFS